MDRHVPAQEIEESLNGNEMMSPCTTRLFERINCKGLFYYLWQEKKKKVGKLAFMWQKILARDYHVMAT